MPGDLRKDWRDAKAAADGVLKQVKLPKNDFGPTLDAFEDACESYDNENDDSKRKAKRATALKLGQEATAIALKYVTSLKTAQGYFQNGSTMLKELETLENVLSVRMLQSIGNKMKRLNGNK